MRVVLDTGVFFDTAALARLPSISDPVILPAVAFTERVRQLVASGRDVEDFRARLRRNGIVVEAYGEQEALSAAVRVTDPAAWKRLARDAMIAGHVREGDRLWTSNPRDFLELGLAPESIVDLSVGRA